MNARLLSVAPRARIALVVALAFAPGVALAQRMPYLQRQTPNEVTVVWTTSASGTGRVCYGTAVDALSEVVVGESGRTQHEVRISELTADTEYFYAATTDPSCPLAASDGFRFRTPPLVGTPSRVRMWVVGDSGTGGSRQAAVRDAMLDHVADDFPDLFLHVGDMAYSSGTTGEFTSNFFSVYEDILRQIVCWPAMGNHEGISSTSATENGPYYDAYVLPRDGVAGGVPSGTEAYYSFDYANIHFVVLDSHQSSRSVTGSMLSWMDEDLAANDQTWLIAYWHHPPYTHGSHNSDNESALIDMRENALPILESYGVDLVFTGHSHIYERSYLVEGAYDTPTTSAGHIVDTGDGRIDGDGPYQLAGPGAVYIVAGHGGTGVSGAGDHPLMYFSELEHGSVILDVQDRVLHVENVRYDGTISDELTLVKGEGVFLLSPLGGETFLTGTPIDIRWTTVGEPVSAVDLEFTLDGVAWYEIATGTENDGAFTFTPPAIVTSVAQVRLRASGSLDAPSESDTFSLSATSALDAISFGDVWEYYDGEDAPPSDWRATTGGWPTGAAQLGYGESDERTLLADRNPNTASAYFRKSIVLEGSVTSASLEMLYDDAIAVWVDDQLVYDVNMDDGFDHAVYASGSSSDNETASEELDPGVFLGDGSHIVAALVKQGSSSSSDLSFDLRLRVTVEVPTVTTWDGGVPSMEELIDGGTHAQDAGGVTVADGGTASGESSGCGRCATAANRSADQSPAFLPLLMVIWLDRRAAKRRRPQ